MEIRLNKMLSDAGLCSRREADKYIKEGRVRVNNDLPRVGQKVTENDKVMLDDISVTISKQSIKKANAEAAKKPKVEGNKPRTNMATENKEPATKPEKRSGLRPGKYGKYNKYAAARAHAREANAAEGESTATGESHRTQPGRRNTTRNSYKDGARPQTRSARPSHPQEGRNNHRTRGDR